MQKKVLALHDLSGFGRSSLVPIISVLSAFGHQCVPLPTAVFSTHMAIPGWVKSDLTGEMHPTIDQYDRLGLRFEAVYAGFLGSASQIDSVREAAERLKAENGLTLIDPVMGDNGKAYSTVTPALIDRIRALCGAADLILPNYTEAQILLQRQPQTELLTDEAAQALADELTALAPGAVVTGLPLGKYIGCAGSGKDRFLIKKLHISRSFPGTGDLYGAVLIGSLLQGNALSAAADNAAEFVALSIQSTPAAQDTRYGVWFEPLLPRLCPASSAE